MMTWRTLAFGATGMMAMLCGGCRSVNPAPAEEETVVTKIVSHVSPKVDLAILGPRHPEKVDIYQLRKMFRLGFVDPRGRVLLDMPEIMPNGFQEGHRLPEASAYPSPQGQDVVVVVELRYGYEIDLFHLDGRRVTRVPSFKAISPGETLAKAIPSEDWAASTTYGHPINGLLEITWLPPDRLHVYYSGDVLRNGKDNVMKVDYTYEVRQGRAPLREARGSANDHEAKLSAQNIVFLPRWEEP